MKITDVITEAASPAQQAAIAISMKKAGKKPKQGVAEGSLEEDKGMTGYNAFKREWRAKHGADAKVPAYDSKEYTSYVYRQNDKKQGVTEGSEANDDLVSLLNSYEFYSDNGSVYVNGNGDKIARIGSNWKHQSGQRGTGAEELGNFLDSIQPAVESNVSESADYLPEK